MAKVTKPSGAKAITYQEIRKVIKKLKFEEMQPKDAIELIAKEFNISIKNKKARRTLQGKANYAFRTLDEE